MDYLLSKREIFRISTILNYIFATKTVRMRHFFILTALAILPFSAMGQATYDLEYYIWQAQERSPLIADCTAQAEMQGYEKERLKAAYTHSRIEASGDYLFVPIVQTEGGKTRFKWNKENATDYYGYDLGQSSGHAIAGVRWTKPLLGNGRYKVASEQSRTATERMENSIRMERHQLERIVTEQYLLCLLDLREADYADSIGTVLVRQKDIVERLAMRGMARRSDVGLIAIEQSANADARMASLQSFRSHLTELNAICGIDDTTTVALHRTMIEPCATLTGASMFDKQYIIDSMATMATLKMDAMQYKPQLSVFVDGGEQIGIFSNDSWKHFGMSAGLTFSWLIADGRQRHLKELQAKAQLQSISAQRNFAETERRQRQKQYADEMAAYDKRIDETRKRVKDYESVLTDIDKYICAGQSSVIDYVVTLRSKIQAERNLMLMQANRDMLIVAWNYWNW